MAKPLSREQIIRKALDAHHRVAFTMDRVQQGDGEDDRVVNLSCASETPVTHFLWSRWEYVDIELSMDKKAIRTARLKSGAAFLMDHNPGDQRGVIDDFEIAKPKLNVAVRMSRRPLAEELLLDMRDGQRPNISLGFMIHKLVLVEERKNEPDLYRAVDWEPYEISSVSIPADISVGVGRAMQMRAEGGVTCPDCELPLDECTCEPAEEKVSNASRSQRASSTQLENKMADKDEKTPGTPAVDTRSAQVIERDETRSEIEKTAKVCGDPALATRYFQENIRDERAAEPTVADFKAFVRANLPPATKTPTMSAADVARATGSIGVGFEAGSEHVEIDRKTRAIVEQQTLGLTDTQMNAVFSREYREAFITYIRSKGQLGRLSTSHERALSEGTDSEGGFLVPAEFLAKMVEREPAPTALQSLVTGLQAGTDKLTMPKNNYSASNLYTTGVRVQWVDEKTGPTSEADATDFGNITIPIHTAMMYHDVTNNMIEDSAFDILGWLSGKFRETADVVTENVILNGSGIGQPSGILLNPGGTDQPAVVNSGNASLLTADGLIDLAYSLLGRYLPSARFVFNRISTEKAIAKLKDDDQRYLFAAGVNSDGLATARPTSLLGFPFLSSDFMPDVAANAYPAIFGDLGGYYLVRRVGFSIQVLNEIVATANKVRVLGRMRLGGQVAEDWELKVQKVAA